MPFNPLRGRRALPPGAATHPRRERKFLHRLRMRKRPVWLPWAWRKITMGRGLADSRQKRDLQLVLDSCAIDFIVCEFRNETHLYVPPLLEKKAGAEIDLYLQENDKAAPEPVRHPLYPHSWLAGLFLLPLFFIYGFQHGLGAGWLPPANMWTELGAMDAFMVLKRHEWYRLATALTLHASIAHLAGNLFFGSFFLSLLARMAGIGRALFLTVAAGIGGNLLNALFRPAGYRSLGFSTAIFASLGAMAGIMIWRVADKRKLLLPLGAALALLAMLGTEGENTDYGAHLAGLGAGFALGIGSGYAENNDLPRLPQWLAALLFCLTLSLAWLRAFGIL